MQPRTKPAAESVYPSLALYAALLQFPWIFHRRSLTTCKPYESSPLSRSSASACFVFSSESPIPRSTSGAFVNWISR